MAAIALFFGPIVSLILRLRRKHVAATVTIAITAVIFLIAAHIAFERFSPMLSSKPMADIINERGTPNDTLMLYGDQAAGSSVIFYSHHLLNHPALLVHGRTTSMLWGSYYPDAPKIFLEDGDLTKVWGMGERKWLFVPGEWHDHVNELLAGHLYTVSTLADKTLYTDRPIASR
jgi:hypothetical protein